MFIPFVCIWTHVTHITSTSPSQPPSHQRRRRRGERPLPAGHPALVRLPLPQRHVRDAFLCRCLCALRVGVFEAAEPPPVERLERADAGGPDGDEWPATGGGGDELLVGCSGESLGGVGLSVLWTRVCVYIYITQAHTSASVESGTLIRSQCMACAPTSSPDTGWKVPAPWFGLWILWMLGDKCDDERYCGLCVWLDDRGVGTHHVCDHTIRFSLCTHHVQRQVAGRYPLGPRLQLLEERLGEVQPCPPKTKNKHIRE